MGLVRCTAWPFAWSGGGGTAVGADCVREPDSKATSTPSPTTFSTACEMTEYMRRSSISETKAFGVETVNLPSTKEPPEVPLEPGVVARLGHAELQLAERGLPDGYCVLDDQSRSLCVHVWKTREAHGTGARGERGLPMHEGCRTEFSTGDARP